MSPLPPTQIREALNRQGVSLAGWNKAKGTCSARGFSGVVWMVDAIRDRHFKEIEWANPIEAGDVQGILAVVGSSLMVGVYAATRAEEVLHGSGIEAVARQHILALQDPDPACSCHDNDGAAHPAIGTGTAADRIEAVAERRLEPYRAAMALAGPNIRVVHHVVRFSFG